jgi:hypothetical protein
LTIATPHELFYKVKPDLCVLFPFGAIGYYHGPSDGGRGKQKKFESKAFTGVALVRSDNANGLVFWNPMLQQFCVSANHKLDADRSLAAMHFRTSDTTGALTSVCTPTFKNQMWNHSRLELKHSLRLAKSQMETPFWPKVKS